MKFKKGDLVVYKDFLYQVKSCGLLLRNPPIPTYELVNMFGGTVDNVMEEEIELYLETKGEET